MSAALIVFAKPPIAGQVKTRLTPELSEEAAARLYEAFLRDALAQYVALDVPVRLYISPPAGRLPGGIVPEPVTVHEQVGPGLGARMANAFEETLQAGLGAAVIIGTDHPTLPTAYIREAFSALDTPEALCIGPSEDGGYYLLGMNSYYPAVFEGMTYSHADVFDDTVARAARLDARLTILPTWYDVDTPDALRRMLADLEDRPDDVAPYTRVAVRALFQHP